MKINTSFLPVILFAMSTLIVHGENQYNSNLAGTISVAHVGTQHGDEVNVPVTVSGFHQVSCIELHFRFNSNVINAGNVSQFLSNVHPNLTGGFIGSSLTNDSTIIFSWFRLTPVNIPDDAKLFDLGFAFCNDLSVCLMEDSTSDVFLIDSLSSVHTGSFFNNNFKELELILIPGSIFAHAPLVLLNIVKDEQVTVYVNGAPYTNEMITESGATINLQAFVEQGFVFGCWCKNGNVLSNEPVFNYIVPSQNTTILANTFEDEPLNTLLIQDVTIASDDTECFDSENFIVTAGDGTIFLVEYGSVVNMVAGQSIILKPGTTIKSGSNLWAYIDQESPYCDSPIHYHHDENSSVAYGNHQNDFPENDVIFQFEAPGFKMFPNPTTGHFNVLLERFQDGDPISVEIYDIYGKRVLDQQHTANKEHLFSLQSRSPGIYFVRVSGNDFYEVQRIVKK